jgi:hypothetical protein
VPQQAADVVLTVIRDSFRPAPFADRLATDAESLCDARHADPIDGVDADAFHVAVILRSVHSLRLGKSEAP